jgi:hypothetical protein
MKHSSFRLNTYSVLVMMLIIALTFFFASCTATRKSGYGCPSVNIPAAKPSFRG